MTATLPARKKADASMPTRGIKFTTSQGLNSFPPVSIVRSGGVEPKLYFFTKKRCAICNRPMILRAGVKESTETIIKPLVRWHRDYHYCRWCGNRIVAAYAKKVGSFHKRPEPENTAKQQSVSNANKEQGE